VIFLVLLQFIENDVTGKNSVYGIFLVMFSCLISFVH